MHTSSSFTIYNASAGSGKTFTLTVEYLCILLTAKDPFAFQRILAITFTNKAVGEMKSRVLDSLIAFAQTEIPEDKKALYAQVKEKTQLSSEAIATKALHVLKQLLANYARFEISTIDAFTQRIIRTFAKDLGLSTNFEIEIESLALLQEAVDSVIDQVGQDPELTQVILDFALEKTEEDKSGNISKDVLDAARLLLNENDIVPIQALSELPVSAFAAYKKKLQKEEKSLVQQIHHIGKQFFALLEQHGIEPSSFNRRSIPSYFEKLLQEQLALTFSAKWQENIATDLFYIKNTPPEQKAKIDALHEDIVKLFQESKEKYYAYVYSGKIKAYLTQLSLLNVTQQALQHIKSERNLVLISDFNRKISEQVKQQPVPFIYERLGERFQHYFIDEFQDTSTLQWENLIPLTEEALVKEIPPYGKGSLRLIGDAKQSIYAWRGGDAQQLINLSLGKSPFSILPETKNLHFNYRSEQEIITFNNTFFQWVATQVEVPEIQQLYLQAWQESPKKERHGKVSIDFLPIQNQQEALELYPQKVLEVIVQRKATSAVQYKDFCVLVRKKTQGIAIANALNKAEIPIISSETLLLKNNEEVQFLLAMMKFLANEDKTEEAYLVLKYLAKEQELAHAATHLFLEEAIKKHTLWESIHQLGYVFSAKKSKAMPLYDAAEYLVQTFLKGDKMNAYVQFFLDEVFAFSTQEAGDMVSFLKYWERVENNRSISAPEGENAVQIMTIHKSKGLQFPIVIYPFAEDQLDNTSQDKFWIPTHDPAMPYVLASGQSSVFAELPGEVADLFLALKNHTTFNAINLLYVALTRAAKELYILSKCKETKAGVSFDSNTYASLFHDYLAALGLWKTDQLSYCLGSDVHFFAPSETAKNSLSLRSFKTNPDVAMLAKPAEIWQEEANYALTQGKILHEVMASVYTVADVSSSVEKAIRSGLIDLQQQKNYVEKIMQVVQHPLLEAYYTKAWQSHNEQELVHAHQLLRPDRICYQSNGLAVLIDYKTGGASPHHQLQIKGYKDALTAMGYRVENALLVYLNEGVDVVVCDV